MYELHTAACNEKRNTFHFSQELNKALSVRNSSTSIQAACFFQCVVITVSAHNQMIHEFSHLLSAGTRAHLLGLISEPVYELVSDDGVGATVSWRKPGEQYARL